MMPILVQHLRVESISDPTPDPYGQPGFSALIASVDEPDSATKELLRQSAEVDSVVVVRCATLEVEGRVSKNQSFAGLERAITILVDDVRYYKPDPSITVERRKLPQRQK